MDALRRAVVKKKPEPGASVVQLPVPSPGAGEVLVRVRAAAVCGTDVHIYRWNAWARNNVRIPLVFGHEISGTVEATGEGVTSVREGDRVAVETHVPCGHCFQCKTGSQHICENMRILGVHMDGGFSDYAVIPEECLWKLPDSVPFEIGALYEPCGVAAHSVFSAEVGARVVVIFGCGPIGVMAANIAHVLGAKKVLAVDLSEERLSMAASVGADILLNPSRVEVISEVLKETDGRGADVAIELSGSVVAAKQCLQVIRRGGQVVFTGLPSEPLEVDLTSDVIYREARIVGTTGRVMYDTWYRVSALVDSGLVDLGGVITHRFPIEEIDEAMAVASAGKSGKVILTL